MQALSGLIVGGLQGASGMAPEAAYRAVFGFLALMTGVALLVYLRCDEPHGA